MSRQDNDTDEIQGEGNYTAAEEYDENAREFAESGKVDKAARDAEPEDASEQQELEDAEEEGRSHARGDDDS